MNEYSLHICHLYPDILNLYGDTGNIRCMQQRLQWRGIDCEVTGLSVGDRLNAGDYDLFFIGGGQDFEQDVLLRDAEVNKKADIISAIDEEKVFLAICGGYQILGQYYRTWDGQQMDFIGAIDVATVGHRERMIGNYMFTCDALDGERIVGFENHSGKTYLGEGVEPLGRVLAGYGNNGEDGSEGARCKNVFATYCHGPMLPKNPKFCDYLLELALHRKYGHNVLHSCPPLDDTLENRAHDYMEQRLAAQSRKA
ncbi:MAG: type 1 glutamine amidotransferase [Anaerovoracaceae bacterium]|jgi:CobQ-like glutamine amidotransferase family enzyme